MVSDFCRIIPKPGGGAGAPHASMPRRILPGCQRNIEGIGLRWFAARLITGGDQLKGL